MVFERFLAWIATAPAGARAEAAGALVSAYERPDADRFRRGHLDRMMAVLLDDRSIAVRRALAEAAAVSNSVPRQVAVALSRDCDAVAEPVLQLSGLLGAADLVAAVAIGGETAHCAIAARAVVPTAAAAALVREAGLAANEMLCRNPGADLPSDILRAMLERFGGDGTIRDAVLRRPGLDPELRYDLANATACALSELAVSRGWLSDRRVAGMMRESLEKVAVTIAAEERQRPSNGALRAFVSHLQATGRLTPALLLRSLLSGETALFAAALSRLAGLSLERVHAVLGEPSGLAFASLYARAAMPPALLPTFRSAVGASRRVTSNPIEDGARLVHAMVTRVQADCTATADKPGLAALLSRFEGEAMRDDVRVVRSRDVSASQPRQPETRALIWIPQGRPAFRIPFRRAA